MCSFFERSTGWGKSVVDPVGQLVQLSRAIFALFCVIALLDYSELLLCWDFERLSWLCILLMLELDGCGYFFGPGN